MPADTKGGKKPVSRLSRTSVAGCISTFQSHGTHLQIRRIPQLRIVRMAWPQWSNPNLGNKIPDAKMEPSELSTTLQPLFFWSMGNGNGRTVPTRMKNDEGLRWLGGKKEKMSITRLRLIFPSR